LVLLSTLCTTQSPSLIPAEYSLPYPWSFTEVLSDIWVRFEMCANPPYANCYVQTSVSIPDRQWNPIGGNSVNVSIFSGIDNCANIIVKNDPYSTSPTIADFLYTPSMGSSFFVHLVSGGSTELQGTFDVKITCDKFNQLNNTFFNYYKSGLGACPAPDMDMKMSYKLGSPASVKTSSTPSDWLQFELLNCLPPNYNTLIYTAQAVDTKSAFSTRICKDSPCFVPNTWLQDRSGSALNTITVSNYPNNPLYFSVSGWGEYNSFNNFIMSFSVDNI